MLDDGTVELLDANHKTILELWSPEGCEHALIHAARIMACVNVWEGTSTEELDYVLRGRQLVKNRDKQLKKA